VAANLNRLMASDRFKDRLGVPRQVIAASEGEISNGTLGRVRNAENGTRLDTVDALAKTFGIEPWQLLVPDLNPAALPQLANPQLLSEIRSLLLTTPETISNNTDQSAAVNSTVAGKKKSPGRLPGEVLRTGPGGSTSRETDADRLGAVPQKRGRRRA
jgi:hypothetical protein